jgi:hypothetical protein
MDAKTDESHGAVAGQVQRSVRRLAEAWRAWRRRRYWTPERQLEHLRNMVQGDHRWLAHDKTADALTTRYLAALAPDWMSRQHAWPDRFRREIGLCPHEARRQRAASGEVAYTDGPLPERGWD